MAERLTAEELDELIDLGEERRRYKFETTEIPTTTFDKLLAVAEECERLRGAIEKHRRANNNIAYRDIDGELWEVLK